MVNGVLAGLAAGALWGLVFVAPRMVDGYSSVDLTAGRFVAYGIVAALVCASTRRALPDARQALSAIGLSLLGFTGYYLLLVLAIRDAGTEVPSLVIGTIPIWIMLLGKPGHLRWAALVPGILLTAAGLALMTLAPHAGGAGQGAHYWRGILWACASLASWTAFALLNAAWLKRHPEVSATAHSSSAPAPVASPSQLAQSVALTSGCRFSQAAFSSANAVQEASEAQAHRMPRQ